MSSDGQTQFVDLDAAQQVANLVVAIDAMADPGWSLADQVRYLRLHLERGIDDLQQAEDSFCELVKDGLYLAVNNMQDARLQFLEKQLADVKNYSLPTEELLFEFVILIVVEAVIAGAMEIAAPFVLNSILGAVAARETRGLFQLELDPARQTVEDQLVKLQQSQHDVAHEIRLLEDNIKAVGNAVSGSTLKDLRSLYREYERVEDEAAFYKAAAAKSLQAAEQSKAKLEAKSAAIEKVGENFKLLLENPVTKAGITRFELSGGDEAVKFVEKLKERAGKDEEPAIFQTGNRAAYFISIIQRQRREAAEGWMAWRQYVQFLSDDDLRTNASVRALLYQLPDVRSQILASNSERALRGFAKAFELFLWYDWASFNGILSDPTPVKDRLASFESVEPGDIVDGVVITTVEEDDDYAPPMSKYGGDSYRGIVNLNDEQAMYLYFEWAKDFFTINPKAVPAPLEHVAVKDGAFDYSRYDEVPGMAERDFLNFTNDKRAARLNEIKFLVIIFLRKVFHQDVLGMDADFKGFVRKLLGVKDDDTLRLWLHSLPQGSPTQPDQSDPANDLGPLFSYLLEVSPVGTTIAVGDARSQLENAVTDLDLKISLYPLQTSLPSTTPVGGAVNSLQRAASAPATSVGAPTADDALDQIGQMQQSLQARYADFQKLAAGQDELLSEVAAAYGDRIATLTSWEPNADEDLNWHWYGPEQSASVS